MKQCISMSLISDRLFSFVIIMECFISVIVLLFSLLVKGKILGCILLELFWLFLFQFRNNRIHGISIFKRTLIHSENRILMAEVSRDLLCLPVGSQAIGVLDFPPKICQKNVYSAHSE